MCNFLSAALPQGFVTEPCTRGSGERITLIKALSLSQRARPPFYASHPAPPLVKGLQGPRPRPRERAGLVGILHLPFPSRARGFLVQICQYLIPPRLLRSIRKMKEGPVCNGTADVYSRVGLAKTFGGIVNADDVTGILYHHYVTWWRLYSQEWHPVWRA
jgi:hypothetical protein